MRRDSRGLEFTFLVKNMKGRYCMLSIKGTARNLDEPITYDAVIAL